MELWLMTAVVAVAVGVALIAIGVRGRRIDRHPLCAACGFDLIGRTPGAPRCPECGADVSGLAIRVGHRVPRIGPLYGGVALCLPGLLVVAATVYVQVRGINVTPHKPAWWLVYELGGSAATEATAFAELTSRMQKGTLGHRYVRAVAEHCLDQQERASTTWYARWSSFIEAARANGKLTDAQWARYAVQGFSVNAYAPSVDTGQPVVLTVDVVRSRHAAATFVAQVELQDVRLDGRPVPTPTVLPTGPARAAPAGGARERYAAQLDPESVGPLPTGPHELRAVAVLTIYEHTLGGNVVEMRTVDLLARFQVRDPSPARVPSIVRRRGR